MVLLKGAHGGLGHRRGNGSGRKDSRVWAAPRRPRAKPAQTGGGHSAARGRDPSISGPITARSEGTQAAATPRTAGSAYRDPGHVAYAGTTSKTLAPGMRLGWLVPPARLHADLVEAKHAADLGSPALPQLVLARLIATGELEQHIRGVRKRQRTRRDALLEALRSHLPQARVQGVPAGLHLLVTFPALDGHVDDRELAGRIDQAGVLVHPLSWHRQLPGPPGLVLGYAAHTPDQLREAARRIGEVLRT